MKTNCKYCYSEIDKRASICPHCRQELAFSGVLRALFVTGFPILTTLVSLGFAFYEKYEKGIVQDSLVQTENRLVAAEVQSSVAEEAVENLSKMLPQASRSVAANDGRARTSAPVLTVDEKLDAIDSEVAELDFRKDVDKRQLQKLFKQRIQVKSGVNVFPTNR